MVDRRSVTFDLSRFYQEAENQGQMPSKNEEIENLSMIAIRLSKSTIGHIRTLTSEGMNSHERLQYVQSISDGLDGEVFEFSTCNRVLYVGFGIDPQQLIDRVLSVSGLEDAPFKIFQGMEVWRYLVRVCSGLDSFIIGELQVMGQFRGAISWHKKNNLLNDINGAFFDHVVAGNRVVRKELGFTKTPESMLSLATSAIQESMESEPGATTTVIGYGEMGRKAVEVLMSLGQKEILVISRSAEDAASRTPEIADQLQFKQFADWSEVDESNIIISTIRNTSPTFNGDHPIPVISPAKILDFSWPPSVDSTGIHSNQILLDVKYWIRAAHKLEEDWNYADTIDDGNSIIHDVEERFMQALNDKNQGKFRAYIYSRLESLSGTWEQFGCNVDEASQMSAFSREIATWICSQRGEFNEGDLQNKVLQTERAINSSVLTNIAADVTREMIRINGSETLSEVTV